MSSISFEFEGDSSFMKQKYFPPVHLDKNSQYVCGLIDFQAYNSIPNVDDSNNKFHYGTFVKTNAITRTFSMPNGIFEINEFCNVIVKLFETNGLKIKIHYNQQAFKFELNCNKIINFIPNDSIRKVFGFNSRKLSSNKKNISDIPVNKTNSNELYIDDSNKIYVNSENNKFYIEELKIEEDSFHSKTITLPVGCYEIEDIEKFLSSKLDTIKFHLHVNKNTLKCEIICSEDLDFRENDSIGSLLGYSKQVLIRNQLHISDKIVDIIRVNILRVECDIVTGSYINNKPSHVLYSFFPSVENGFKIVHTPQNVLYLPITARESIDEISIRIVDQNNQLANFRGERINVKINIKKL